MPTLTIAFLGPHSHATPWGAPLDGQQLESPPSPWRICRALHAAGVSVLGWDAGKLPEIAVELLSTLASVLPEYQLPASREEPPVALEGATQAGGAPLRIGWGVTLSPEAFMLLAELAESMSYVGRPESWVVASAGPGPLREANCRPHSSVELADDTEPVTLLAPVTPVQLATWREAQDPIVPSATRRVLYTRPQKGHIAPAPPSPKRRRTRPPIECALLSLSSLSSSHDMLPPLRLALPQMESLHRGLLSCMGDRDTCPELTGRDINGAPLRNGHRHAHYIPLALGDPDAPHRSDAAIDHVLIYADAGLPELAQRAIERLRWVGSVRVVKPEREHKNAGRGEQLSRSRGDRLTTTLIARGDRATIREALRERSRPDPFAESRIWESYTPFIAPRYVKDRHPLKAQVQAELASRGLPPASTIEIANEETATKNGLTSFTRSRRRDRPQPPSTQPWSLRITFEAPLCGRILALGYGSHFGLGILVPATD